MNKTIIKSCLLGLNSKNIDFTAFPKEVKSYLDTNKEQVENLLDALSLHSAFMMAGQKCTNIEHISEALPKCEDEVLPYISKEVNNALKVLFSEKNYSLKSFIPLAINKLAKSNMIVEPDLLPQILPLLDKQLKDIKEETLQCFGKRGQWIYNLIYSQIKDNSNKEYIDLSRLEKMTTFRNLMQSDKIEALAFLEEIYAAETPANQLNYLKNSPLHQITPEIFSFLNNHFNQTPDNKSTQKLKTYFQLMWLHFPESEWADEVFENFFSKIWAEKTFLKRKLVTVSELKTIYNEFGNTLIENFYPVANVLKPLDQFIFFALASVPFSKWTDFLNISNTKFIKLVAKIKPIDSPKVQMYSFLNALVLNATIHKDIQAAEDIFNESQFEFATADFLSLFEQDDLMAKFSKYTKSLNNSDIKIYDLDLNLLPLQWNAELTKVAIEQCLENITNSRVKLNTALWKIGPYIHNNALQVFDYSKNAKKHSYTLKDDFEEVINMKIAFDKIKF